MHRERARREEVRARRDAPHQADAFTAGPGGGAPGFHAHEPHAPPHAAPPPFHGFPGSMPGVAWTQDPAGRWVQVPVAAPMGAPALDPMASLNMALSILDRVKPPVDLAAQDEREERRELARQTAERERREHEERMVMLRQKHELEMIQLKQKIEREATKPAAPPSTANSLEAVVQTVKTLRTAGKVLGLSEDSGPPPSRIGEIKEIVEGVFNSQALIAFGEKAGEGMGERLSGGKKPPGTDPEPEPEPAAQESSDE